MSEGLSRIEHHMYKSWIRENPEIAMRNVMEAHNKMKDLGMKIQIHQSEHYYDIIGEVK